mgnify:CR=1 FL=1
MKSVFILILGVVCLFRGHTGEINERYTVIKSHKPFIQLNQKGVYPRQLLGTFHDPFLCRPDYKVVQRTTVIPRGITLTRSQYNFLARAENSICWLPVMQRRTNVN